MSLYSGSQYEGEYLEGWYHGQGTYTYPNGVVYKGQFFKGQFHGEGTLIYPNGGKYVAKWDNGKMKTGNYFFNDNLQYEFDDWKYCTGDDRRFYPEHKDGIQPAGATQMTREKDQPNEIPEGTYDVGVGYYEPIKSIIYKYDGNVLRTPSEEEVEDIMKKCRYNPRKALKISGDQDKIIQKVIKDL
ncbi:hypothetical protein PPERSA_09908 [Pseudocohnilembus persalinus]|uniref:MORN repeat-containing protein 5 n=1 Tax=Pseudocohnilembus persalinus TaxID=266149 RepID=A0A0V0QUZ1_PSEPJ|nr:hypothetical protein PPERSA_09908 [Pseudocohnilembus persalinus]|eukprot:KRX05768.1 hypothetical protein PPERSA_09908 [Pseudocohnilembus persalinus]